MPLRIVNQFTQNTTVQYTANEPIITIPWRRYSSTAEPDLKATLREIVPEKRELLKKVKSYASTPIGSVKVENTLGGMR